MEAQGLKVGMLKMDPYLNVDPGTMNPCQHGEVYVLEDGAETDLDLGHYERFTHAKLTRNNSVTSGKIYEDMLWTPMVIGNANIIICIDYFVVLEVFLHALSEELLNSWRCVLHLLEFQ